MNKLFASMVLLTVLSSVSTPAVAYIGPGLGLGTVGVILGVIASVLLAIVAVVWYPIKRAWRKLSKKRAPEQERPVSDPTEEKEEKKQEDE